MKKFLSLVLATIMVAMVFATIPFSAFAAETPVADDDIVAQIVVGETTTDVKRSEFAGLFTSYSATADTTVNVLMDIDVGGAQLQFKPAAGVTITVNGDVDGDGKYATITGSEKATLSITVGAILLLLVFLPDLFSEDKPKTERKASKN